MGATLIATFTTQVAAASVIEKLLSRGVRREHLAVRTDESVDHVPASASAPTSVISELSHRPAQAGLPPQVPPQPAGVGYATVSVRIAGDPPETTVRRVLELAGAASVSHASPEPAPQERGDYQPELGRGERQDVERALDAVPGHGRAGPEAAETPDGRQPPTARTAKPGLP